MNDFNFFAVVDYNLIEQHKQDLISKGFSIKGKHSNYMNIRNELVDTFFDAMINDKPINPRQLYLDTIDKFSENTPDCQSYTCDNYNLSAKGNCEINKKNACLSNSEMFYKGRWEYLKKWKRKKNEQ